MNTRTTGIILGAVAGGLLGLLVAWIILDKGDADAQNGPAGRQTRSIKPNDVVALALAAFGLVRQVSVLRQR